MRCSGLLLLGLVLSVAHCLEIQGGEPLLDVQKNITALLGEDVYLGCRYLGESEIENAMWRKKVSSSRTSRPLAGFLYNRTISHAGFSVPDSINNLTVRMSVSSVEAEGHYICEFHCEDGSYHGSAFLTVQARPEIQVLVQAELINGSQHQSVSCSAVGGRPQPQISWLVGGRPPLDAPFTVVEWETIHSNGTSTLSSTLSFPTHLQDEEAVTCVVQHPTLPKNPKLTTVRVETYTRPNVAIKAEMVQHGGSDFWVVSCVSSGGRPNADISLALNADEGLQSESSSDQDTQRSSFFLPAAVYEGYNVTCVFEHPKFTHKESRVLTLPHLYLSGVQLANRKESRGSKNDFQDPRSVELLEGQSDVILRLEVAGNTPRYNLTCTKDDELLPEGVEVVGSSLAIQGPVGQQHDGLYGCVASYHHLNATLQFNVTVKPHVIQPVGPIIWVDLRTEDGRGVIECSAADAVPAANMSWHLPEGVSGDSWFNFTSHNGSYSVKGVLLLPACSPRELAAECVINHPTFEQPENRSITLPLCARPNITISSSTKWKDAAEHAEVNCSVESVAPAATITWQAGDGEASISPLSVPEPEVRADGSVSVHSSVHLLSSSHSGQNVTCTVEHPSLEAPEKRTIRIPVHKAHLLTVSLDRQQGSCLWLAVCEYTGEEGVGANLKWALTENATSQNSLQSKKNKDGVPIVRLTYQFTLDRHEGQDLTCVHHSWDGSKETKTLHVPRYYISSVRVLNHTIPLQSRYGGEPGTRRLSLQQNQRNQRVLLRVEGDVPEYNLICRRSDGSHVQMDGATLVFQSAATEQDEGLYSCLASFCHHSATVSIQVDVTSQDELFATLSVICISVSSAIALFLSIAVWAFCKGKNRTQYKEQESLSALTSLMSEPSSPTVKDPPGSESDSKDYAQLISYSIVIDVKSTV